MAMLRRKLRVVAIGWLVFQVAWLTALVPRDCCAAHRPVEKSCHHESAPVTPETECRLSGACDGPMAALFALLSAHGILPESTAALPAPTVRSAWTAIRQNVVGRFEPPDLPPPRV